MEDSYIRTFCKTLQALIAEKGATTEVLARLLGSEKSSSDLLAGKRLPTIAESSVLGAYFGVDPSVLRMEQSPSLGVSLRLGKVEGIHDVSNAVQHASRLLAVDRLTREWGFEEPTRSLVGFSPSGKWHDRQAGEISADRLRAFLGIEPIDAVAELTELVESIGCPVEYRPLPNHVHGISVPEVRNDSVRWVVLINSKDGWGRQRYTLAHELSHILYRDSGQVIVERATVEDKRPERIADSFARHFLLPRDAVEEVCDGFGKIKNFADAAVLVATLMFGYGISRDATVIALRDDGITILGESLLEEVSRASVSELMQVAGRSHDWNEMNQAKGLSFPSPRLTKQALDAYSEGLISLQSVANVIAEGDLGIAKQQLREAGWENMAGV
ncbi:ImmA/IrrE family metallo-endopeptidase [Streptomyces sp. BSE7-9]|uniref:ImmA/IrrE family metallo-endopeptidase n=1 Tax=Streptomyces sp. BSE7-9 TaxID=2759948 RepID=UPI0018EEA85B|nr:ImmA/IrrE family metallo-endopeptidase [Streptomyces sp. BSE7-9]MBJ6645519.1 ImmA/IrrE family metallo-endopeptidase [Streptomyces sp. BSE7-9]